MPKTYKAEDIKNSKRIKRQVNQRGITFEMLESLMEIKYPLKDFDLNLAIEELVLDACIARGIITTEGKEHSPEEIYGKCLTLLQDTQKMTGSYFDTAQNFLTQIQDYLSVEPANVNLRVNKSTAL